MSFYDTYDARAQGLSSTYKQAYVDSDLLTLVSYIFQIIAIIYSNNKPRTDGIVSTGFLAFNSQFL